MAGRSRGGLSLRIGPPCSGVYVPRAANSPFALALIGSSTLPCAQSNSKVAPCGVTSMLMSLPPHTSGDALASCPCCKVVAGWLASMREPGEHDYESTDPMQFHALLCPNTKDSPHSR